MNSNGHYYKLCEGQTVAQLLCVLWTFLMSSSSEENTYSSTIEVKCGIQGCTIGVENSLGIYMPNGCSLLIFLWFALLSHNLDHDEMDA